MASSSNTSEIEIEGPELRHLGFVRTIGIGVFVCAWSIYDYAKRNHTLLMLPAQMLEVPVRIVLGPVDKLVPTLHAYTPMCAKRLVRPFKVMADKVINKAVIAANEAQARGPESAARYVAAEFQKFVLTTMAKLWVYFKQYLLIRALVYLALPGAAYTCRRYNRFIRYSTRRGYPLVGYLPVIPINELAEAVHQESLKSFGNIAESPRYHSD
ncbi:REF/SRPP-like protein At1g67360 [Neltuma alba]|uniref:REF/SRPP-like protein At1g67360 n=1 Tax=Neltuma alba TaxID=207710 RepID=UPI0010A50297|nr:REF/SRPP-like protein At1g67360 [Prosopis alba]